MTSLFFLFCLLLQQSVKQEFWPNVRLKHSIDMMDFDGERLAHGLEQTYSEEGQLLSSITWQKGVMDGDVREWFCTGKLMTSGSHQAGRKHGRFLTWHDNGQLYWDAQWQEDTLVGDQKFYWSNGQPMSVYFLQDGNRQSARFWTPEGQLIPNGAPGLVALETPGVQAPKVVAQEKIPFEGFVCDQGPVPVLFQADFCPNGRIENLHILNGTKPIVGYNETLWEQIRGLQFQPGSVEGEPRTIRMYFRWIFQCGP